MTRCIDCRDGGGTDFPPAVVKPDILAFRLFAGVSKTSTIDLEFAGNDSCEPMGSSDGDSKALVLVLCSPSISSKRR